MWVGSVHCEWGPHEKRSGHRRARGSPREDTGRREAQRNQQYGHPDLGLPAFELFESPHRPWCFVLMAQLTKTPTHSHTQSHTVTLSPTKHSPSLTFSHTHTSPAHSPHTLTQTPSAQRLGLQWLRPTEPCPFLERGFALC